MQIFPIISSFGATGLLVEYEDMFPYHGKLAHLKVPHAYTREDISKLHELAAKSNLTVIPLIQTFGHFEVSNWRMYLLLHSNSVQIW